MLRWLASVALAASLVGCSPTTTLIAAPVYVPATPLSPEKTARYEAERFELKPMGQKNEVTLVRKSSPVPEADFRTAYRQLLHTNELDTLALARAKHENPKYIALATGATVVGVAAIVVAATPGSGCSKNEGNCAKGAVGAGLMAGAGLFALGCEVREGAKCLLERSWLKPEELEASVDRYNRALVAAL